MPMFFVSSNSDLVRTDKLSHSILTRDAIPVRQPVSHIPPYRRQEVQILLDEMLEQDEIQWSTSPWASPIVLMRKKDGMTRFCVNYHKLNDVTREDAYFLPRIDATLNTLAGLKWFSTLDSLNGYWQVEVAENNGHKTAFCTQEGLFEFKVMPFGLCNAPATFQYIANGPHPSWSAVVPLSCLPRWCHYFGSYFCWLPTEPTGSVSTLLRCCIEAKVLEVCSFPAESPVSWPSKFQRKVLLQTPPRSRKWQLGPYPCPPENCSDSWDLPVTISISFMTLHK